MKKIIKKLLFIFTYIVIIFDSLYQISAQEIDVPVNVQIPLFFKIFAFDRNFKSKIGNKITFLIFYQENFRHSQSVKNEFMNYVNESSIETVLNIQIEFIPVNIHNIDDCRRAIDKYKANIVYIAPLRTIDISDLSDLCNNMKIISLTCVPEYVDDGISISIENRGDKPSIVINLTSAKLIGCDYSSQLLKYARVIN